MPDPSRPSWQIEPIGENHIRDAFDCGRPPLNQWLQRFAGQYERRDLARTYVAIGQTKSLVMGYYALSNHMVRHDAMPPQQAKGLPVLDVPVVLIGRLAVDQTVQGQGLGSYLLIDALRRSTRLSEQIGIRAVEVHALDSEAQRYYLKFGFVPLLDDPHHLFLPMSVVRKLGLTGT